jgi:hypothetical protein
MVSLLSNSLLDVFIGCKYIYSYLEPCLQVLGLNFLYFLRVPLSKDHAIELHLGKEHVVEEGV